MLRSDSSSLVAIGILLWLSCGCVYGAVNLESIVGLWLFDDDDPGVAADSSGRGHDGQIRGAQPVDGKYGGALLFDGINAFVNCGNRNNFDISEEISLMAWVKSYDIGNSEHNPWITKGDHAWALKEVSSGELEFFIYNNGWNTNHQAFDPATINNWHHFAGVYNGQQLKVYIDGELKNTTNYNGAINVTQDEVHLAHNSEVGDRFFKGLLDEVRIYNIALSDARISAIYNNIDTPVHYSPSPTITDFSLHQNYPNPFNPTTTITYQVPKSGKVELSIYNLLGRKVVTLVSENQTAGQYQVKWDASPASGGQGFASGIYYYVIKAGEFRQVKKMVLVK